MTGLKINYVSVWQRPVDLDDSCSTAVEKQFRKLNFRSKIKGSSIEVFGR